MKFSIVFGSGDERFVKYYQGAFYLVVNPHTGQMISDALVDIERYIRCSANKATACFNIVFDTDGQRVAECHASTSPAFSGQEAIVFSPSQTTDVLVGSANRSLRDCMILCCEHGDNKWPMRWPYEQKKTCAHREKRIPLNPIYSAPLPLP